jgi:hypothetical protein
MDVPQDAFSVGLVLPAVFFAAAGLAGLDFPKDPLKILPFFVFLSPLPMMLR